MLVWLVNQHGLSASIFNLDPIVVALQSAALTMLAAVWSRLIVGATHLSFVSAYMHAQLLKYLPTGVANIAALIVDTSIISTNKVSITVRKFAVSVTLMAIGAATLSLAAVNWVLFPTTLFVASLLYSLTHKHWITGSRSQHRRSTIVNLWTTAAAVLLVSLSFALYARGQNVLLAVPIGRIVAVFAVSWFAGLVAVVAPAGIGVREAGLTLLLPDLLSFAEAIEVSIGHRINQSVAEIVCVILVAGFRLRRFARRS